ncbi:uncharacterized protein LOC133733983 isoform X2 [Rosa rugosa]|nr:uncharacterized protein LOC133712037 isoform X2 [Rosa rugosa]XP_062017633.1 uncharacterized protein LOC133733983 isoform X2 [Rosa rugosa]
MKKTYGNILRLGTHAATNATKKINQIPMDDEQSSPNENCHEPVKKARGITKNKLGTPSVINPKLKRVQIPMDNEECIPNENSNPPLDPEPVKKTRGITVGLKAHAIVSATKKRIPIKMDKDQKLPETIQANAMFVNEIGSFTRKLAPLKFKWWRKVPKDAKNDIKEALTTNFEFDWTDPELRLFVEKKMAKAFGSWRSKLHGHFKKYAHDLEYARAHPPGEKLFGERSIDEWEWLCDELFIDETYVKRSQVNAANRNQKEYNHCGGSRPYQKHMEAALKKGKNVSFVENWSTMHQHHDGQWINEAAEQTGKKMLAELNQTKEKLAEVLGAASLDEIEVPVSMQLDILANGIGVAKGRGIRGLGYGPRKEPVRYSESEKSANASVTEQKVIELTATVEKLLRHINHIEEQLATVEGYTIHHSSDDDDDGDYDDGDDGDDDDVNIYGDEEEGAD